MGKRVLAIALAAACLAHVATLSACTTLAHHTAEPYRSDPERAASLEREAAAWCEQHEQPGGPPTLPFRFDGCSMFPDGSWRGCCQTHDYAYWCGGSEADRETADAALAECVAGGQSAALGKLMWAGVRAGGHPFVPAYFRWGYGHAYAGCYPEAPRAAP